MNTSITEKGSQQSRSTLICSSYMESDFKGRAKPVLSVDYIVGLTDGEGCFYVNVSSSNRYNAGARVELRFMIKLQARDREVLERVKETLGCGAVYFQKEVRRNHTQCFRYTVGSHGDILTNVIPFFLRHPLQSPSKRASFLAFCRIAQLVEQKAHLTTDGVHEIYRLKVNMNQRMTGLA